MIFNLLLLLLLSLSSLFIYNRGGMSGFGQVGWNMMFMF